MTVRVPAAAMLTVAMLTVAVLATVLIAAQPAHAADGPDPGPVPALPDNVVPMIPGTPPADRALPRAVPPPRPAWKSRDRIVYAFDRPARDMMERSADLSAACRRGEFIQNINLLYRAFGPKEQPFGVAYGQAAINLVDPGRRRREDTVYFFQEQDTGRCSVYTARKEDIRPWFIGP